MALSQSAQYRENNVADDAIANLMSLLWLFGWVALWPLGKWWLRLSTSRTLLVIFVVGAVLELASFSYLWSAYQSGNRDWFMAWLFPQAVATFAWIASIGTTVIGISAKGDASAT